MWSSERFLWPLCSSSCSVLLQFRLSLKGFLSRTLCSVAAESPASSRCEIPSLLSPEGELTTSVPVLAKGLLWDNGSSLQKRQALAVGGTVIPIAPEPVAPREGCSGAGCIEPPQPLSPARTAPHCLYPFPWPCPSIPAHTQVLPP